MTDLSHMLLVLLQRQTLIPDEDGWHVIPASGGSTDRTFHILDPAGDPAFVARLARPGSHDKLHHEGAILREIADATLRQSPSHPALLADPALPHGVLLVHEYVTGVPAPLATLDEAAIETLAACLARVHSHPRAGYMVWPSLTIHHGTRAECFRARVASLHSHDIAAGPIPAAANLLQRLEALPLPATAGWDEPGFALIHGDLSPGNILWRDDGSVALIDWEYARDGDPAEDLAYLIAEQDLSPAIVADLADAYVTASGDPWALARMPAWLPFVALDSALWWTAHLTARAEPLTHPIIHTHLARASRYLGG